MIRDGPFFVGQGDKRHFSNDASRYFSNYGFLNFSAFCKMGLKRGGEGRWQVTLMVTAEFHAQIKIRIDRLSNSEIRTSLIGIFLLIRFQGQILIVLHIGE